MDRKILTMLLVLIVWGQVQAQKISFSLKNDSTFNAADDYAQTSEGFDVNVNEVNVVNLGIQIAQDVAVANANRDEIVDALSNRSYYRQRIDLNLSSALPERTNVYSIITFLNDNSGNSSAMVTISNLEVEHFFNNNFKFRVGRLANSVSESQFFGRMALEETSAHVFGRKLFVNDALEFDGSFKKRGGPTFFIGLKPVFKPFNLKGVYAGIHQAFKSGVQLHGIFSLNRQFEADMTRYIPDFKGKDVYFAYEAEVAYKQRGGTVFLNVGGNAGYTGLMPHASGRFDFLTYPAKMNPSLKFLPQVGVEAEVQGALTDRFTALNVCAYCKVNITRRMVLTYYCTPQFIWQDFQPDKPSFMGGVVNYLRLSVTVGKPTRMFL